MKLSTFMNKSSLNDLHKDHLRTFVLNNMWNTEKERKCSFYKQKEFELRTSNLQYNYLTQ